VLEYSEVWNVCSEKDYIGKEKEDEEIDIIPFAINLSHYFAVSVQFIY
jgi:hypothetical protein